MTSNHELEYECVINFRKTLRDAVSVMSKCDWKLCVIIDDNKKFLVYLLKEITER